MSFIRPDSMPHYLLSNSKKFLLAPTLLLCCVSGLIASDLSPACAGGPAPRFEIDLKELSSPKSAPKKTPAKKPIARRPKSEQKSAPAAPVPPVIVPIKPESAAIKPEPATVKQEPVVVTTEAVAVKPEPPQTGFAVKSISGANFDQNLDLLLTAVYVPWSRDRVIEGNAGTGSPESFSLKVDRYIERDGKRYVLMSSRKDSYEYTISRLLEMAGYSIISLDSQGGVSMLARQLLTQLGLNFSSGKHRFTLPDRPVDSRIIEGFLVTLINPRALVFLTETPLDAVSAEILASSTVEPYREEPGAAASEK